MGTPQSARIARLASPALLTSPALSNERCHQPLTVLIALAQILDIALALIAKKRAIALNAANFHLEPTFEWVLR